MQKELAKQKAELIKNEIANSDLMIGFYTWLSKQEKDKKKSAELLMKADQLKLTKDFNAKFIEYAETL